MVRYIYPSPLLQIQDTSGCRCQENLVFKVFITQGTFMPWPSRIPWLPRTYPYISMFSGTLLHLANSLNACTTFTCSAINLSQLHCYHFALLYNAWTIANALPIHYLTSYYKWEKRVLHILSSIHLCITLTAPAYIPHSTAMLYRSTPHHSNQLSLAP